MGGLAPTGGGSGPSGTSGAARRAEEARQRAEAARKAAEAARKAAEEARRAAKAARQQQAATQQAAAAEQKLQAAEEKVALTAKKAEEAMGRANTLATGQGKTPPFTQKDIQGARPRTNELVSAFDGTRRRAELEKLLGTPAPPKSLAAQGAQQGEKPPVALDALDARDIQAARKLADGQTYTAPSSGAKYQVKQNPTTGETVLSDAASGNTVTAKADGSYTSTVVAAEQSKTGGTRNTSWTKAADARGIPISLESRKSLTEQHPETGTTTSSSTTRYDATRSPPVPLSRTEEVQMERPPAALSQRRGTPQGPATVKTETQFDARGVPTKQVKTTQVRTRGFNADAVGAFEVRQGSALQNASKGPDHHKTDKAPTSLTPGESSLTLTEETRFNAKGEPATSRKRTESVALEPVSGDKNGNGVQVVRTQQEVTRGPKDAASADSFPAISSKTPGNVTSRTTVTAYDPDGSRFDEGHASRTQTVSQSSGTVDANGQLHLKHQPTEVKSLQEGGDNRWAYDHFRLEVGADGKPVPGQKPKELDRERQLPFYEDVTDFVSSNLGELADMAGSAVSEALGFVKDTVLEPVDALIDKATAPLEDRLTEEVEKLNSAGDTLTLSGGLDVKVGLKAGIEGEAEISRTEDGKYQLSAEVTADVGMGLVGSASVSAGGRMEFTFDTPEEAARAAIILGKGPAALASGGEDHAFLVQHLSAMEVNLGGEVEAGVGAKFGPGGAELSASLGATTGYRVEFDKGKPTHLVRTTELEGSGVAELATGLKGKAGLNLGGEVSGSLSLETRIPLDASQVDGTDVLAFLASPTSAMFAGPAETSISVEGSVDTGTQGQFFTAEVSGLSGEEVQAVTKRLLDGEFENAFDDVDVEAQFTTGSFKDREVEVGAKLGVVDFHLDARHRDMTAEGGGGNGSTSISLGRGRPGGSDGTSGTNGSTGGPDRKPGTTTDRPPPPTQYRVNPATGQLMPVTPQEGGPSRTDRPGATRPTQPPEMGTHDTGRRPVPVVRNPELQGRTTHVRYDNGRVRIEAGPAATDADIQAHMETARVLQRYEGAVGKVRQLIDKVKQALTGMPGYGSQGFESRLEVQKLSNILKSLEATQAQLEESIAGATGKPTTAEQLADLERQISSVEAQLRTHAAQVDSLTAGRGYVAREDDVTPVGGPDERLPRGVAPWVSDILPPHIRPKDVVVHEGDLPSNPRPNAAYWDGQTLRVTDERRQVESVVNPERIKNLPTGVPPWVARALPPDVNPADVRVESSKVTHPEDKFNRRLSKPRPNTAYWVDGRYLYVTDSRGRVASVEGDLHLVGNPVRSESTQSLGNKGYNYTEKGRRVPVKVKVNAEVDGPIEHLKHRHDEGGHLIGAQFGGPPEFLNYVPQTRYQNGSVTNLPWDPRQRTNPNAPAASGTVRNWHEFEMDLAKHLRDGDAIRVRIRPRFISDSTNRPNEIRVDGLLTTPDGEVSRGDWRFHNTTKMDKFEKDKPEDQEPPDASAP